MSGGWTPSLHLFSHAQGKLAWSDDLTTFLPEQTREDCTNAGASRGLWGIEAALKDGAERGREAAEALGKAGNVIARAVDGDRPGSGVSHTELP
ncbi:sarcosine oxidase subunit alpha domain protein, partial [Brucella grignonensis]